MRRFLLPLTFRCVLGKITSHHILQIADHLRTFGALISCLLRLLEDVLRLRLVVTLNLVDELVLDLVGGLDSGDTRAMQSIIRTEFNTLARRLDICRRHLGLTRCARHKLWLLLIKTFHVSLTSL